MTDYCGSEDAITYEGRQFGIVYQDIFRGPQLGKGRAGLGPKVLYCYLFTYRNAETGKAFPSQKRIANDLGVSIRSVLRWIDKLIEAGWIDRLKRLDVDPEFKGHPDACIYHVRQKKPIRKKEAFCKIKKPKDDTQVMQRVTQMSHGGCHTRHQNIQKNKPTNREGLVGILMDDIGMSFLMAERIVTNYSRKEILHSMDVYKQGISKGKLKSPGWIDWHIKKGQPRQSWHVEDFQSEEYRMTYLDGELSD